MNAELYILRNMNKSGETTAILKYVAHTLKKGGIRVAYKTELDEKREKIIYGIADSIQLEDNINLIVVPNAFDTDAEDTLIYKTLASLTASGGTADKKRLEDALCGFTGDFQSAIPVNSNGNENGYIFMVNDVQILLLPTATKENIVALVTEALKEIKPLEEICKHHADEDNSISLVNNPFEIEENAPIDISSLSENDDDDDSDSITLISGSVAKYEKRQKKERKEQEKRENKENKEREKLAKKEQKAREKDDKPKHQKMKPTFKERFVPLKEDDGKEKARKIILDIAILVFIVTAIILIKVAVVDPLMNNMKYDELRDLVKNDVEIATEITTDAQGNEVVRKIKTSKDWKKLKEINKDVIAWVKIKDTKVDYPVLQRKTDTLDYQYYLYRDIYENYSGYGSVFADFRSNKGIDSKNIILHGHNMKDGSMFENLMGYGKYSADMDYYKEHPTIEFDTPKGEATYKIISIFKTSTLDGHGEFFNYLTGSFVSDAEFMNYVYLVRERSLVDTGVTCNEDDQLITLSTCSYEYSDFRTVVVARKTRVGESSKVDVSKAKANPNPLWPDVYYNYNAASKPKVTTFKTEYKKKNVPWYDGKGNLKGKERMFTLHDGEEEEDEDATDSATENVTQAPTDAPIVHPESIMFDYSQLVMDVGDIETLKIIWTPDNTTEKGITWTSSDANVAKVASGGRVTAVAPGECTITAETTNGHSYAATVIVNDILATKLTLSSSAYNTSTIGETYRLYATYQPSNATNSVEWASSNHAVATVSNQGVVKIHGYGSCTVTATIDSLTCKCVVTVKPATTTPPATNPPATNPPATNPPATNPPATNPPVEVPDVTEPVEIEE
ncbi:MAG: class B sortase [Acutalibacteraceae bacterium]|nr:class B sortase [Acutalibacteraceae bacterium]